MGVLITAPCLGCDVKLRSQSDAGAAAGDLEGAAAVVAAAAAALAPSSLPLGAAPLPAICPSLAASPPALPSGRTKDASTPFSPPTCDGPSLMEAAPLSSRGGSVCCGVDDNGGSRVDDNGGRRVDGD